MHETQNLPAQVFHETQPAIGYARLQEIYAEPTATANRVAEEYTELGSAIVLSMEGADATAEAIIDRIAGLQAALTDIQTTRAALAGTLQDLGNRQVAPGGIVELIQKLDANQAEGQALCAEFSAHQTAQDHADAELNENRLPHADIQAQIQATQFEINNVDILLQSGYSQNANPGDTEQLAYLQSLDESRNILGRHLSDLTTYETNLRRTKIEPNQILLAQCVSQKARINDQLKQLEVAARRLGIDLSKTTRELKPIRKRAEGLDAQWRERASRIGDDTGLYRNSRPAGQIAVEAVITQPVAEIAEQHQAIVPTLTSM